MNAENLRQTLVLPLGSAAGTVAALLANCDIQVKKIALINGGALAASDANFVQCNLMNGATLVASVSNKVTGGQGAIAALTGKPGVLATDGKVLSGSTLSVVSTVGGTGALTAAALQVEYVRLANK